MTKSEKLFEMLELIKEYPNLTAKDLSRLCNVSERGIYRYINTLEKAGISIRFQKGGYRIQEGYSDFLAKTEPENMIFLRDLLVLGMENSDDKVMLQKGKELLKAIEVNLPRSARRLPSTIEILPESEKPENSGGTITIGHSTIPDIINPILTSETISESLMTLIFSSLVEFDDTHKPIPDAAERWEVSADGLTWTFFLRNDIKFHDGHPLTAYDVEFTYKSIIDPDNMSPLAKHYDIVDSVSADDEYVFSAKLKSPFAPFIYKMGQSIAPKHLLENENLRETQFNRNPVGSGPFKLADWADDNTIILEANEDYFISGRPILDSLIFKSYSDRNAAIKAISKGKMDIALDLASADLMFVTRYKGFRTYPISGPLYYAIIFNLDDPLFGDIRVRKAIDYAIDRESIIKNQLKGYSEVCTGPFNVNSWAYNHDVQPSLYDVEEAKRLLSQAGWSDSDNDGILEKDGKPFEITLTVPNISDSLERLAVAIRAQLMKAGIEVKVEYMNNPKFSNQDFQAILARMCAGFDPDGKIGFWKSGSGSANLASYKNDTVDKLIEQGRKAVDPESRKEIYHRLHKLIHDDYPAIFLASGCEFIGSSYRFKDGSFPSMLNLLNSIRNWQITDKGWRGRTRKSRRAAKAIS